MRFYRKKEQQSQLYGLPPIFTFSYVTNTIANKCLVPSCNINGIIYEVISANSFIKLRTEKGLKYWMSQAENGRRQPDWKIHFAIEEEDIPAAWDIIAKVFLDMRGEFIMKAKTHAPNEWPKHMCGREITVYVPTPCPELGLSIKDVPPDKFWLNFIATTEHALSEANIRARPIASGELKLGSYCSLRNEAFIPKTSEMLLDDDCWEGYDKQIAISNPKATQYIYPPNASGYNAAGHPHPGFVRYLQYESNVKGLN